MKKITLFAVAVVALSFASCKKDRTCACTETQISETSTEPGYTVILDKPTTSNTTYTKIKKNNVLATTCVSSETTQTRNDTYQSGTTTLPSVVTTVTKNDCELK